jgi:four helix bundle protein
MAQASLADVETQMEIASRLGYLASTELSAILEQTAVLGKQLHALRNALAKRI